VNLSPAVMTNLQRYMEWQKINAHALLLEDLLIAGVSHLSKPERLAYDHMVGVYEIGIGNDPPQMAIPIPNLIPPAGALPPLSGDGE
jgi:hypothetical protein